jgi:PsbP
MNSEQIANLVDLAIPIAAGVYATLLGLRVVGPKLDRNDKFDAMYTKWIKHFKWLGPLLIVITVLVAAFRAHAGTAATDVAPNKTQVLKAVTESLSAQGKLAQQDQIVAVSDGFKVLIPKDFTYSKPQGTPYSMVAMFDAQGASTPGFFVQVVKNEGVATEVFELVKNKMIEKNSTTQFSKTQVIEKTNYKLYSATMSTLQNGNPVKGGMLFFENEGKIFTMTYGTREDLFNKNAALFEKIIRSFEPN